MVTKINGVQGEQRGHNRIVFKWESIERKNEVAYIWIMKRNDERPKMVRMNQCVNNWLEVEFANRFFSMNSISQEEFLLWASDSQMTIPENEIERMWEDEDYICRLYCGECEVEWCWEFNKKQSLFKTLVVKTSKVLPGNLLYYEYMYGGQTFRFYLSEKLNAGQEYRYDGILFPDGLEGLPALNSVVDKMRIIPYRKKGISWKFRR